jgi:magnesium chelatase subunit D
MSSDRTPATAHADPALAACLFAVNPTALGGVSVRSRAGAERDRFIALVREFMPPGRSFRRLPLNIGDGALLGGIDLAATLQASRPVLQRGLLAEADCGIVIAPMAERLPYQLAARLAAALDTGEAALERDGFRARTAARIAIIALDEGIDDDERPPPALLERLAFHLDLAAVDELSFLPPFSIRQIEAARRSAASVQCGGDILRALCGVASDFGVNAIRAPILALKVARLHAALAARVEANDEDAIVAARLVLLPRATVLPAPESAAHEEPEAQDREQSELGQSEESECADSDQEESTPREPLADIVLDAVKATLPSGLLAKLQAGSPGRSGSVTCGRAGLLRNAASRGRQIGARKGDIKSGARLHLVETLRSAAPWQALRRKESSAAPGRVAVRREDFRVIRFKHRTETATIFVVDASGSSAMQRLAEAKGAVELLLADCYTRRDQVALISFRGKTADMILPPTRSLARAKRTLAALPGGGATPLAAAVDAARALADALRRKGIDSTLVFLTDGRANVGRDGASGRDRALSDAYAAARDCRAIRLSTLVVDTSPQPEPAAEKLAAEFGGRYMQLPYADAAVIWRAIRRGTPRNKTL